MYKRTLYYWSKLYSAQLRKWQKYSDLCPVIAINILDFNLFEDNRCHRNFILKDDKTNEVKDRLLDIHFLELRKRIYLDQNNDLWAWAEFLKSPNSKNLEDKKEEVKSIRDAQNVYDTAVADPIERKKIRLLDKTQRDNLAYKKAQLTKAQERGEKRGIKKGRKEGLAEGEHNAKVETAKNFLKMGLSVEQVTQGTGLQIAEIRKL